MKELDLCVASQSSFPWWLGRYGNDIPRFANNATIRIWIRTGYSWLQQSLVCAWRHNLGRNNDRGCGMTPASYGGGRGRSSLKRGASSLAQTTHFKRKISGAVPPTHCLSMVWLQTSYFFHYNMVYTNYMLHDSILLVPDVVSTGNTSSVFTKTVQWPLDREDDVTSPLTRVGKYTPVEWKPRISNFAFDRDLEVKHVQVLTFL